MPKYKIRFFAHVYKYIVLYLCGINKPFRKAKGEVHLIKKLMRAEDTRSIFAKRLAWSFLKIYYYFFIVHKT